MRDSDREPVRTDPSADWQHYALWRKVHDFLPKLPERFTSSVEITGIHDITEVHQMGSVLAATIEHEVVRNLNLYRDEWDPAGIYNTYRFYRQPEGFPDVILLDPDLGMDAIVMGIELKSWYLLAKEGVPSFRYQVSPEVCSMQDLFVVFPWALSSVLSGKPIIFEPFVSSARHIAEYRNFWWKHIREARSETTIASPTSSSPYPRQRENYSDTPSKDSGNNFGRIARVRRTDGKRLMEEYIQRLRQTPLLGIAAQTWAGFFRENRGYTIHDAVDAIGQSPGEDNDRAE